MLQRVALVLAVAMCAVAASASSSEAVVGDSDLAYAQESMPTASSFEAAAAAGSAQTAADATEEGVVVSSLLEVEGNGMRHKAHKMATNFVEDMHAALKSLHPKLGAAARAADPAFEKSFRSQCRLYAPSTKMCRNFLTIVRLSFMGQNPFAQKHRTRFVDSIQDVVLRWVAAWRRQKPKRALKQRGNPWSPLSGLPGDADPLREVRLYTRVYGSLNAFGRVNTRTHNKKLLPKPKPTGTGAGTDGDVSVYTSPKQVKDLYEQVKEDLLYLREKVYAEIKDKKFNRMVGNPEKSLRAVRLVRRVCDRERKSHFFPPTFCKAVEYLASVNFVGRNFLKQRSDFAALLASFMQHNHKMVSRYGFHVVRRPNYRQDVTAVTAKFALRVRPSKFNLRSLAREMNSIVANVLGVPRHRVRIASLAFGRNKPRRHHGRGRHGRRHRRAHHRAVKATIEFLPKRGDRRVHSHRFARHSVDRLAETFRAMAKHRKSPFFKVPILSRIIPRTLVMTKTLGRRRGSLHLNKQSANIPRFAEAAQSIETEVLSEAEVAAAEAESEADAESEGESEADAISEDAETVEMEEADEEFMDNEEELDAAADEMTLAESEEDTAEAEETDSEEAEDEAADEEEAEEESEEETEEEADEEDMADEEAAAFIEVVAPAVAAAAAEQGASEMADVSLLDVAAETQALHLSADTAVVAGADESEGEDEEANAEADTEEVVEVTGNEADADEEEVVADVDAAEDVEAADEEAEAEETAGDVAEAEWTASQRALALVQNTEQIVAADDAEVDDEVDEESVDAAIDEIDAAEDSDSDEEVEESDAAADESDVPAARDASAVAAEAPTASAPEFAPLPEVNGEVDAEAELAAASLINLNGRIADGTVFLETETAVESAAENSAAPSTTVTRSARSAPSSTRTPFGRLSARL